MYQEIIFTQGEDAEPYLEILDEKGITAALRSLLTDADYPNQAPPNKPRAGAPWGAGDRINFFDSNGRPNPIMGARSKGAYALTYNLRLGYIGVTRIVGV